MSGVNIEVTRGSGESAANLIRRFTKRLQGAGVLPRVRSIRYASRPANKFARKKKALSVLLKRAHFEELVKLGKPLPERKRRGRK